MPNLLPDNVLELSISERIQLVQDIWDSIVTNTEEISVIDSQKQELDRRLKLFQQNPDKISSWEEVKQKFN
jgi:putative addiction module component (TIGR02574 family)